MGEASPVVSPVAARVAAADSSWDRANELSMQSVRLWGAVLVAIQTAFHGGDGWTPGWISALILVTTAVWVNWAVAAERRGDRLPLAGRPVLLPVGDPKATRGTLTTIGVVAMIGDFVGIAVLLANNTSNPSDPVQLLPLLLVIEAAVRWGYWGGVVVGIGAGAMTGAWSLAAQANVEGSLPTGQLVFRVALQVMVGMLLGATMGYVRRQRRVADVLFVGSRDLVAAVDRDGVFTAVNPSCKEILGFEPDDLVGRDRGTVFDLERRPMGPFGPDELAEAAPTTVRVCHREGHQVWLEVELIDVRDGAVHLIARDVSERRRAESELRHQVDHDPLTGLWNRAALVAYLDRMLVRGYRPALVFIDLDRFKGINDTHGHLAGDRVLVEVASRLRDAAGHDGQAARYAGDEFCVVVDDADDLDEVVGRTRACMAEPVVVGALEFPVAGSFGTAVSLPGDDAVSLVDRADHAMYDDKGVR